VGRIKALMIPRAPEKILDLLKAISEKLPVILKGDLTGIYLYGSLTQNAFDEATSDIDCVVVTERDISARQFESLKAWFAIVEKTNSWTPKLQITFLVKDQLFTMNGPGCLYQFGKLSRSGSDGNPIIWLNILESGLVLYGAEPKQFVSEISTEMVFAALVREAGYLREELIDRLDSEWRDKPKYRVYAAFTLCRILYTFENQRVVSKSAAAEWALGTLPTRFGSPIQKAMNGEAPDLGELAQFIQFTQERLQKSS
jgi:hypothetical protein